MPQHLTVQRRHIEDLNVIASVEEDRLKSVLALLQQPEPPVVKASDLQSLLREELTDKEADVLVRQLISLSALGRARSISASDVVTMLIDSISRIDADKQEAVSNLERISETLVSMLDSYRVQLVMKAIDLSFDFDNLLASARLVTDLRPVFDTDDERIVGGIITHSLRLRYGTDLGPQSLTLALDEDDVKELRRQCDRALAKAEKLRSVATAAEIHTVFVAGEEIV